MTKKYKICVVSSSRADFGILTPLLKAIEASKHLSLFLIATGAHLSREHGFTINEVESSEIKVNCKIDISVDNSSAKTIADTMSRATSQFANKLVKISPDIVLLLGDRYEMLGIASAAMCLSIPIAHIHGGEVTEGANDDAIRHAITKLSHLHFVCHDVYKNRVIQLGEKPETVFNTGALGIDNIYNTTKISRNDLEAQLNIRFSATNIMISYHSATLDKDNEKACSTMLEDLSKLKETTLIFTMPNADLGGKKIASLLRNFCDEHKNAYFFDNLGLQRYISCLSQADFVIGNSSSGILEAPFLGCYTINIGTRQKGRLQPKTVINVKPYPSEILSLVMKLKEEIRINGRPPASHLFGDGSASKKIASILEDEVSMISTKKSFHDIY